MVGGMHVLVLSQSCEPLDDNSKKIEVTLKNYLTFKNN
jgi:hypothetical protein